MRTVVAVIGVVGRDAPAAADALAEAGVDAAAVDGGSIDDSFAAVVALEEAGVLSVVRAGAPAPVLPVDAGPGVGSVPRRTLPDAAEALIAREWDLRERPLLAVRGAGPEARALFDVTLATAEPATISEFRVGTVDERGDPLPVAQVRADGVVVATPAGSHGYARSAGGSLLAPGAGVAAVVPVAPFTVDPEQWVLNYPVRLTVERDEVDVTVLVDDREAGRVDPGSPVTLSLDGSLRIVALPETRRPLADAAPVEKT